MSPVMEFLILAIGILLFPGTKSEETIFKTPEIHSLHIYSDIRYRYATTTVTSRIKNIDSKSREAIFDVTLPNEAFITNLTLEIDGKIILGEIKEKEAAKKQYVEAQQRGESAGYIGTRHRETNKFNLAVTVAPQSKVSFNLTYQELLKRKHGYYEQVIYIDPRQPVPDLSVTVAIVESREITHLRVPPLRNDVMVDIEDLSTVTVITTPTPTTANVKFVPSIEFQTAQSASGMSGQFVLQYDVEREMDLGDVLVVNGYFVHFFAPEGLTPIPKDVLFILDTSGSMIGKKLSQLKQAMKSIIRQLVEGDRMNIMTFSGSTSFWKTEMVDVIKGDVLVEADRHIDSIKASGWTNIELALVTGITFLNDRLQNDDAIRSPVVVFLTDGEATSGVTDTNEILKNVRDVNQLAIPVFSLAFGENADYDIVKKISIQNNGLGRKIYEASDAAMQIANLYTEISVTLLNNITFQYLDVPVANVTKREYTNYFNGTEVVICGRLEDVDDLEINSLTLKVTGNGVDQPDLVLSGALSESLIDISFKDNNTGTGDFEQITEKVWAYLTIKQLLDKELASSNDGEKRDYKKQVLDLSLKYGFVTPLTSMVVTLPKQHAGNTSVYTADDEIKRRPSPKRNPSNRRFHLSALGNIPMPKTVQSNSGPRGHVYNDPSSHRIHGPVATANLFADHDYDNDAIVSSGFHRPRLSSNLRRDKRKRNQNNRKNNKGQKAKGKRKKNKRKNNKGQKGSSTYPLRAKFQNLEDPICFNMYDKKLETGPEIYTFYSDINTGLHIDVKLEKTILGKLTDQGGIREVHLQSGDTHRMLTSKSVENIEPPPDPTEPWTLINIKANKTDELRVELEPFELIITTSGKGFLNILVKQTDGQSETTENGIIGQVFGTRLRVIKHITKPGRITKRGKRKPGKEKVLLKLDNVKVALVKKEVDHSSDIDTGKCFPLNQHEIKMLNMTAELNV